MFHAYIKVYGRRIHRLARRLSRDDPDLADDLEQEARIALWRFDPSRVRNNESAIVMRVARDAMLKWRRREDAVRGIVKIPRVRAARPEVSSATAPTIIPIRRFAPRHSDAAPVIERRVA